ncbi:hypothetical protein ABEB36_000181 [Hypothenemus hampei]|uniref:Uncharacterized protein n=1 Tax=Hypothenemus hampei TaxID=57062 RepID=A0ABD1FAH6_HYPHA
MRLTRTQYLYQPASSSAGRSTEYTSNIAFQSELSNLQSTEKGCLRIKGQYYRDKFYDQKYEQKFI